MRLPLKESIDPRIKLNCIERELWKRRHVYPRLVASGRMMQDQADREIEIMEAIRADYMAQVENAR